MNSCNEGFSWCSGKPTAKNYSEFIWHSENAWSGQNVYTIIIILTISPLSRRKSVMNKLKQRARRAYLASVPHSLGSIVWFEETRAKGSTTNLQAVVLNQPLLPIVSLKYISEQHSAFPNDLILVCNPEMFASNKSVQFSGGALWSFMSFLWFFHASFLHSFETPFTHLFLEESSKALLIVG